MTTTAPTFEKIIPKVIDFRERAYGLYTGLDKCQRYTFNVPNVANNQPINATITLDAGTTILVPRLFMAAEATFTFAGAAAAFPLQLIGVKALPINNMIEQANINLSGQSFSTPVSALVEVATKTMPQAVLQRISSNYMYDQFGGTITIAAGADTTPVVGVDAVLDTLSAMAPATASGVKEGQRGSFNTQMVFSRMIGATTIKVFLYEELMSSPFAYDSEFEKPGWIGQTRLHVSLVGMDWLTKVLNFSTQANGLLAPASVVINSFDFEYYVCRPPSTVDVLYPTIPYLTSRVVHSLASFVPNSTAAIAQPSMTDAILSIETYPAITQYISQPFNLEQNIRKIIVWASPTRASRGVFTHMFTYGISSIDVNYKTGSFFGGWNNKQLFEMSKRNGLNLSYEQFTGKMMRPSGTAADTKATGVGPIIIIDPLIDLASGSFGAVSDQRSTFQMRLNLINTAPIAIPQNGSINVNVLFVYSDRYVWNNETYSFTSEVDIISAMDLIKSGDMPVTYSESIDSVRGGNIFENITSFTKNKAIPWIKEHSGLIKDIGDAVGVPMIRKGLDMAGLGKRRGGANVTAGSTIGGIKLM